MGPGCVVAETTPDRLVAALTAAGWVEEGRREGVDMVMRWGRGAAIVLVPLDPTAPQYAGVLAECLAALERLRDIGDSADQALTEATCSCGGKRWVDDENWQPPDWAIGTKSVRREGEGLIPCGNCNHGGWNVPVGGDLSDPSGRMS